MRFTSAFGFVVLLGLRVGSAAADVGAMHVAPAASVVPAGATRAYVTVTAPSAAPELRPRASVIVYAPDGSMVRKPQSRRLSGSMATFKIVLGANPLPGTYSVFATTEAGTEAVGMPATFEVAPN